MIRQKYYNDFIGGFYDGQTAIVQIDSMNCNSITVLNTSMAGTIFIMPDWQLQPGESFTFVGKELEKYKGKLEIKLTNFFGNINYSYCIIRKKYVYGAV